MTHFVGFLLLSTALQSHFAVRWLPWLVLVCYGIYQYVRNKNLHRIAIALGALILTNLALWRYDASYDRAISTYRTADYIGTGQIISYYTDGRFLIEIDQLHYVYYSDIDRDVGDVLWMTARIQPVAQQQSSSMRQQLTDLLARAFDYDRWLRMKGRYGTVYEENALLQSRATTTRHQDSARWLRTQVQKTFADTQTAALVMGMLIGDRSLLQEDKYQQYIDSGIVHIIAVSGGNIVILAAFLTLFLCRLPLYARIPVLMVAVIAYTQIVGADSSIIRATIMALLTYTAILAGRSIPIWRLMGYAAVVMLLRNPYFLIADIGFIFSFAALGGVVITQQRRSARYTQRQEQQTHIPGQCSTRIQRYGHSCQKWALNCRKLYLLPTIGASMGVFPFLLFFTSSFNVFSLLANILIMPLVPIMMIGGALITLLQARWGRAWLGTGVARAAHYIDAIAYYATTYGLYIQLQLQWFGWLLLVVWLGWLVTKHKNTP